MGLKDIEVFIIWNTSRVKEKEILELISEQFTILKMFDVEWAPELFTENLTSFYEMDLRNDCDNCRIRGIGNFLVVVVRDENPRFHLQRTNKGIEQVNTKVYLLKEKVRNELIHSYAFHASLNEKECRNNIVKLLGISLDDFVEEYYLDGSCEKIKRNCTGVTGWKSVSELFYVLNECVEYVVLRGGDNIPDAYTMEKDGDIDILVRDMPSFLNLLEPKNSGQWNAYRFFNWINIAGEKILIHAKFVGDNYYDIQWEKRILKNRIFNGKIYVPDDEMQFWSLLYHGVFHKENYVKYDILLEKLGKKLGIEYLPNKHYLCELLRDWMKKNKYLCKLHLDNQAGHLVYENIDEMLKDRKKTFYIYKSWAKNTLVGALIICEDLIRDNPILFTSLIREKDPFYRIEEHILPETSELYIKVMERRNSNNEYVWRYAKRYDDISLMTCKIINGKTFFEKKFIVGSLCVGDEIKYYTEKKNEFLVGENVDSYLSRRSIKEGKEGLIDGVAGFLRALFNNYNLEKEYLNPIAWDLYSKNCFYDGKEFVFFDFEARASQPIEKAFMIAVEIEWLLKNGIYVDDSEEIFNEICKKMNIVPRKSYYDYINIHNGQVEKILLSTLNETCQQLIKEIDIPQEDDLIAKYYYGQLESAYDQTNKTLAELLRVNKDIDISHRLLEKCLEIEQMHEGYDLFFKKNGINKIVVHGLGKFGKRFINSSKHKAVEIIGCIDKNISKYEDYSVFKNIDEISKFDLVIVAVLYPEDIVKSYKQNEISAISLQELIEKTMEYL